MSSCPSGLLPRLGLNLAISIKLQPRTAREAKRREANRSRLFGEAHNNVADEIWKREKREFFVEFFFHRSWGLKKAEQRADRKRVRWVERKPKLYNCSSFRNFYTSMIFWTSDIKKTTKKESQGEAKAKKFFDAFGSGVTNGTKNWHFINPPCLLPRIRLPPSRGKNELVEWHVKRDHRRMLPLDYYTLA